nr:DNA-binding protein [Candidatus Symbiopectobacterium sp.]
MEAYTFTLGKACIFLGISRPTAKSWISSGRLVATRKNPSKPKSPYLITPQACIAALNNPMHTVAVSVVDAHEEKKACHYSAEVTSGTATTRRRAASVLKNLLEQRTENKLRSSTTVEKLNYGG